MQPTATASASSGDAPAARSKRGTNSCQAVGGYCRHHASPLSSSGSESLAHGKPASDRAALRGLSVALVRPTRELRGSKHQPVLAGHKPRPLRIGHLVSLSDFL